MWDPSFHPFKQTNQAGKLLLNLMIYNEASGLETAQPTFKKH